MFEFFNTVTDWATVIVNYVVSFFQLVIGFVKMIPKGILWCTSMFGYLPSFVSVFAITILVIAVVLQILNHGS